MNKKQILAACAGVLLAGVAAAGIIGWVSEHKKVEDLKAQTEAMKKQVVRSAIDRSISAQMEDIANEQREISDEKREEALQQTRVANDMRLRSEKERQNALEAERNAVASEKKALEASAVADDQRRLAEQQRQLAEHQRIQAEFSKSKADTLSYIALGRSLASISSIQAQAGNTDIANLLGYASYLFTSRYNGDIYYPAVFQSLMNLSHSMVSWTEHNGAVMNMECMAGQNNSVVSVSNYGEIILSERKGNRLQTKALFKDSRYDFRDVMIDQNSGSIYAVSRTGHLVIIQKDLKTINTIVLDKVEHPVRLYNLSGKGLLVVGDKAVAQIDLKHKVVSNTKQLPFRVVLSAHKDGQPLFFDDKGMMHQMKGLENYDTQKVPFTGKVTAYCASKKNGIEAFGFSDGAIWLLNKSGKKQQLVGHRSRVSTLKINGQQLFSSSYDGSVNLWMIDMEKAKPMTLVSTNNWIMHFNYDSPKHTFWVGDAKGNLSVINISVPVMVDNIKKKLKRNLTREEWNYYIGQDVPYETFIGNQAKI